MNHPDIIYDDPKDDDLETEETLLVQEEPPHREKLNNLQILLEKQISAKDTGKQESKGTENNKNLAFIQLIYNQLVMNEVDEKYANQLISEIEVTLKKDASMDNILASIYQKIILKLGQAKTIDLEGKRPKFIFFIITTGVGKPLPLQKLLQN